MTTYYEVLRPVTPADLATSKRFAELLKLIPPDGYIKSSLFKDIERNRRTDGIAYACSQAIIKRVSPHERILKLDSVKFWVTQLNESGHKNTSASHSTKQLYMEKINHFDEWLPGRSFQSYETVINNGRITRQAVTKLFASVEKMLHYCMESDYGTKTAQHAIREYLASPQVNMMSASVYVATRSAIKSYFNVNDVVLDLPKTRKKRLDSVSNDDPMTLEDFYKMLQKGKPGIMLHTIMMIKLHSGMDSSTLTDRFNYEGYSQIVKHFGTDDYKSWNPNMCPVPITLVRVKTNVQYTTFLERDAITQLQEYLTWKETKHGKHNTSKPLFMTKQNTPIHSLWVSKNFSEVAVRAGVQKKVSHRVYKIRAHELRDILKSTLLICGCKQYAADHVLGHAPRDSYEKQAVLYPEELRAEYAKASRRLNIFSKIEGTLNTDKDPENLLARIKELEDGTRSSKQFKTEMNMTEETDTGVINDMQKKLDKVLFILDALPDDTKKQIAEKLKDSDDEDSDDED